MNQKTPMNDFDQYIRQGEPEMREKGYAWQTAIGLQDGSFLVFPKCTRPSQLPEH